MIVTFGSRSTEKIWRGKKVKKIPSEIQHIGRRKLRMINNLQNPNEPMVFPANQLEKLKGSLKDYYNIRMNDKWRIVFRWLNNDAFDVELIDYYKQMGKIL
jgi:proteic killer suppression protein